MGGTTFVTVGWGKDADDAFRNARDMAGYEFGHGGYSGTIAEKSSFRMVETKPRQNIHKLIDDCLNDSSHFCEDKCGPAACIELKGKALKDRKERFGLKGKRVKGFIFFGWASC